MVEIVSFPISGMSRGNFIYFEHGFNVLRSKLSVSACLEGDVVKIVSFSMTGMCCGQNRQFQHV
jgi:hypothetical protein